MDCSDNTEVVIDDIVQELWDENKRLSNELSFSEKCMKALIEFKTFVDYISLKFKEHLDSNETQIYDKLYEKVKEVLTQKESLSKLIKSKNYYRNSNNVENEESGHHFEDPEESTICDISDSCEETDDWVESSQRRKPGPDMREKKYICPDPGCDYKTSNSMNIQMHVRNKHDDKYPREMLLIGKGPRKCPFDGCDKIFQIKGFLDKHIKQCHPNEELIISETAEEVPSVTQDNIVTVVNDQDKSESVKNNEYLFVRKRGPRKPPHLQKPKKYICPDPECDYKSCNSWNIQVHNRNKHDGKYPRNMLLLSKRPRKCPCDGCNKVFKFKGFLDKHINQFHPNEELIVSEKLEEMSSLTQDGIVNEANDQDETYDDNNDEDLFKRQRAPRKPAHLQKPKKYICPDPECDYRSCNSWNIQVHNQNKHNNKYPRSKLLLSMEPTNCPYEKCPRVFTSTGALSMHIERAHYKETGVMFKCKVEECIYEADSKMNLHNHMKQIHQDKLFYCNHSNCNYWTHNHMYFTKHMQAHQGRFKCPYEGCTKTYSSSYSLKDHKRTHEEEIRCTIDGCDRTFSMRISLERHVQFVHLKTNNFKCQWPGCEYRAPDNPRLTEHTRIHTNEKPYKCNWPGCEFSTGFHTALCRHRYVHNPVLRYVCSWPECDRRFNTKKSLDVHMAAHKNDKNHACTYPGCQFRCVSRVYLTRHIRVRHRR